MVQRGSIIYAMLQAPFTQDAENLANVALEPIVAYWSVHKPLPAISKDLGANLQAMCFRFLCERGLWFFDRRMSGPGFVPGSLRVQQTHLWLCFWPEFLNVVALAFAGLAGNFSFNSTHLTLHGLRHPIWFCLSVFSCPVAPSVNDKRKALCLHLYLVTFQSKRYFSQ